MIATGSAPPSAPALAPALGRRALTALATLGLLLASACGGEHKLVVTVLGVDPSIKTLHVRGLLDGQLLPVPAEVDASVVSFTVPLSAGLTGHVVFQVDGLADDTCTTAEGRAATDLVADGPVSLDVFLTARTTPSCPVVVSNIGIGSGTVFSSDGAIACGRQCIANFDRGTALHLSLRLTDHGHFVGWSGACSGTSECDLTVNGPLKVQANLIPAEICSPGDFCWQNPLPQGHTVRALWSATASDQWAVGDQGLIMHWDGTSWAGMPSGLAIGLHGVWGSSPDNLWVVGENGAVLHFTGTAWQSLSSGTDHWLHGVWGSSQSDVYGRSATRARSCTTTAPPGPFRPCRPTPLFIVSGVLRQTTSGRSATAAPPGTSTGRSGSRWPSRPTS